MSFTRRPTVRLRPIVTPRYFARSDQSIVCIRNGGSCVGPTEENAGFIYYIAGGGTSQTAGEVWCMAARFGFSS